MFGGIAIKKKIYAGKTAQISVGLWVGELKSLGKCPDTCHHKLNSINLNDFCLQSYGKYQFSGLFSKFFLSFNHMETLLYYTVIGFIFMVERFKYSP